MEQLYLILFEVALFLLLGLAYYTYQKRKILREDLIEIFDELHKVLAANIDENDLKNIEALMHEKSLVELLEKVHLIQEKLKDKEQLDQIILRIKYQLKNQNKQN